MGKIYVVTHKAFDPPQLENYYPIEVGAGLHDRGLGFLKDNIGDNISVKNPNYCELTAVYWIWKHDTSDVVGICHYRRFFSKYSLDPNPRFYVSYKKLAEMLQNKDMILPEPFFWLKHTVATGYSEAGQGREKDLKILREIIQERYPEYLRVYDDVLKSRKASYCNMMVCKKETYDAYCGWLFDILFEMEKRVDLSDYTPAEARIFGYLSEILVNVWVLHNNLRVAYLPVAVDKPLTAKRKPLKSIEKIPLLGKVSKILNCMDLGSL